MKWKLKRLRNNAGMWKESVQDGYEQVLIEDEQERDYFELMKTQKRKMLA